jgi:hypothetical protein
MAENHDELARRYEAAMARFEAHVHRRADGKFEVDVEDGSAIGIDDPVIFADLKRSLEHTNSLISRGELDPEEIMPFKG